MRASIRFLAVASILLFSAHRLPAPISEVPGSPTPAPTERAKLQKPKPKSAQSEPKTKAAPKPTAIPTRPRFAGTWRGTLHGVEEGVPVTVVISASEDSAIIKGLGFWGDRGGRAAVVGNTLSWPFLAEKWTMVMAADGKTATVTGHHWPAGSSSGTVERLP